MAVKMPPSMGGPVQAVKPLPGGINGAPVAVGSTSTTTVGAKATGTITFADNPTATDTITINGTSFEFVASGASGNEINISGVNLAGTLDNMISVLNGSAVADVALATYTEDGVDELTITFDTFSVDGNDFTLAASSDTPSGATLTGGHNPGAAGEALYILANVNCHIRFDGQTATSSDAPLPAYTPMVFSVNVGDNISVIRETGDGLLWVHDVELL